MFRVSCLGIWWRHDIWISENLKLDYLENKKNFWSEKKKHFSLFHKSPFRYTKQANKNAQPLKKFHRQVFTASCLLKSSGKIIHSKILNIGNCFFVRNLRKRKYFDINPIKNVRSVLQKHPPDVFFKKRCS